MQAMEKEDFLIQIRDKIRKDCVKLWLPPYYLETNGVSELEINNLSKSLSEALQFPLDICTDIIKELQLNSLENLKRKTQFQECGLATVKIKIIDQGKTPKILIKEVMLTWRSCELKEIICQEISTSPEKLKLISCGKVLNNSDSLITQRVKNGQQILAIVLAESLEEIQQNENKIKSLETVKTDSKLLAMDDDYMRLEDQYGKAIKIPQVERIALIVALTLHEKGRAALKREDYSTALIFFLEADHEFSNCSSVFLQSVDNYALLDLDIAWCYLCLQSFTHLPEAQKRLKRCEEKFLQTYGANLERLMFIKGNTGNEACLFTRLHLLQAIVLYHENHRVESLNLLRKVEEELETLHVDEQSLISLVEQGYSVAEARLGLRATSGDVNAAANYIHETRQTRLESRKKNLAQELLEKEKKKLGKCADGKQYVDPNFVKILVNMGFNKETAQKALKMCNNIIVDSIQYIQENPSPGPSQSKSTEFLALVDDLVPQLVEAGFDPKMAKLALLKNSGDIILSTEELLANDGIISGDLSEFDIHQETIEKIKQKQKTEDEKKQKAFDRIKEDISIVDDDYLDITLVQEEMFLKQYLSLLEKK
ncbi:NEDD8 ultimate buster 1-like [Euwallacea fornicatus]|uniref:NEDD8 ultimate buster 1-like n=1 Tax=Euwallacea fornicatus TaxID=995702 RepID=UPI00338F7FF2